MKKKFAVVLLMVSLTCTINVSFAQDTKSKSPETILSEIRQSQSLKDGGTIDVSKVSDSQLIDLGKAVMPTLFPSQIDYEAFLKRAGGDNSPRLQNKLRMIGYRYLYGLPVKGMVWGMMGRGFNVNPHYYNIRKSFMMGNYGPGLSFGHGFGLFMIGHWITGLVILILFILLILFAIRGFKSVRLSETPIEILRKRYARGEITKDEFERMKKDL